MKKKMVMMISTPSTQPFSRSDTIYVNKEKSIFAIN
jgi:hypothetical protein